jgi:predicted XRE-type DNA-binding protein
MLVNLFERVQFFLQRLKIYNGIPLTTEMMELFGKIMAQVLLILALSTKEMSQRRISELLCLRFVSRLIIVQRST